MTNWIICPVRNGLNYTRDAIRDFQRQDIDDVRIWILNNGSTDGTGPYLASQKGVVVTHHLTTHGVAESWNLALKHLFERENAPYVLVMNNDVRIPPYFYRELVNANLPFATGVGVATMGQMIQRFVRSDRPHPDYSAFLIRRECWDKVGPFDECYTGGYCEDASHHLRAHRKGVQLTCIGIPFLHYACGTIKSAPPQEREKIEALAHANRELFKSQYGCFPGTPEYEALFSPETFGCEAISAEVAVPHPASSHLPDPLL